MRHWPKRGGITGRGFAYLVAADGPVLGLFRADLAEAFTLGNAVKWWYHSYENAPFDGIFGYYGQQFGGTDAGNRPIIIIRTL